jgi:hypothetical protein
LPASVPRIDHAEASRDLNKDEAAGNLPSGAASLFRALPGDMAPLMSET